MKCVLLIVLMAIAYGVEALGIFGGYGGYGGYGGWGPSGGYGLGGGYGSYGASGGGLARITGERSGKVHT